MNPNEIEDTLGRLIPAPCSRDLERRVANALAAPARRSAIPGRRAWLEPLLWCAAGATAAILVMSGLQRAERRAAGDPVAVAASTREWLDAAGDSIEFDADRLPARKVRVLGVDRQEWTDPRTGARMAVETPRERTMAIPVVFQ